MLIVQRNPFARGEYVRVVACEAKKCAWCGNAARRLYTYTWSPDDRPCSKGFPYGKGFCGLACFKAFHQ